MVRINHRGEVTGDFPVVSLILGLNGYTEQQEELASIGSAQCVRLSSSIWDTTK